ncbi:hypothetical protein JCGZ_20328 [Jatropha curcas]|uniref:Aminotransferase-like plant mobile domain-containing protein n=1 Tax=Jatropha curcas TaxID=180498 RepID=A0A067K5M4_JATCU|nr:hypothetical protein JCGZ_20328 [Jatropha curcas]
MASSDFSDENFLGSLKISLDEVDLMADADTHASMTGIFAQTWAFEYFPYTRPELLQTDLGSGLVPLAWRWYKSNLHTVQCKKSLKELRTFFDTCPLEQRPRRTALLSVLEGWVQADADEEVRIGEEIVMAPRTGKIGQSLTAGDDSEDVAPRRRRDT